MRKSFLSILMALCLILSCATAGADASTGDRAPSTVVAETDYSLAPTCEDGNILQCFNWTLAQIKAELPNIAAAGFTSVQTSPLQPHDGSGQWYWLYQPTDFTIGNELGSYSDLQELCEEAHSCGVKIIVDVVANHLAGQKNGRWSGNIAASLKVSDYFHNLGACEDNSSNRFNITHKNIGMPDLNSENTQLQEKVAAMVASLKAAGVDGIRWDAAKHISLPSEECGFWPAVLDDGMYNYGEILDSPAGSRSSDEVNEALMTEYAQYLGVTDEIFSSAVTQAIRDGRVAKSDGNWINRGISADRIVYWAESHDTYGNDNWTNNLDQNVIDRAYALLGARADSQTLYLSRPFKKKDSEIRYGVKGSTHFTSPEVAAVNRFHNAMAGTPERYMTSAGCYLVCRGGGAVVVSPKGADVTVTVANGDSLVPAGTYTDEITGSTWTVTRTEMTGRIGSTGIAVFYDEDRIGEYIIGDADLSGDVEILDATAIQRSLASLEQLSDQARLAADADRDGDVTILDATAIQRWLAAIRDEGCRVGEKVSGKAADPSKRVPVAQDVPVEGGYEWPTPGFYYLSSVFYEPRSYEYHGGIDIAGSDIMNAPIFAAAAGTVVAANSGCEHNWSKSASCGCGGGYGNYVWIDHGNGKETIYGHMTIPCVNTGDYVSAGQLIGYVGTTGFSTGPHLHFECRYYGERYDPMLEYPD